MGKGISRLTTIHDAKLNADNAPMQPTQVSLPTKPRANRSRLLNRHSTSARERYLNGASLQLPPTGSFRAGFLLRSPRNKAPRVLAHTHTAADSGGSDQQGGNSGLNFRVDHNSRTRSDLCLLYGRNKTCIPWVKAKVHYTKGTQYHTRMTFFWDTKISRTCLSHYHHRRLRCQDCFASAIACSRARGFSEAAKKKSARLTVPSALKYLLYFKARSIRDASIDMPACGWVVGRDACRPRCRNPISESCSPSRSLSTLWAPARPVGPW